MIPDDPLFIRQNAAHIQQDTRFVVLLAADGVNELLVPIALIGLIQPNSVSTDPDVPKHSKITLTTPLPGGMAVVYSAESPAQVRARLPKQMFATVLP